MATLWVESTRAKSQSNIMLGLIIVRVNGAGKFPLCRTFLRLYYDVFAGGLELDEGIP